MHRLALHRLCEKAISAYSERSVALAEWVNFPELPPRAKKSGAADIAGRTVYALHAII